MPERGDEPFENFDPVYNNQLLTDKEILWLRLRRLNEQIENFTVRSNNGRKYASASDDYLRRITLEKEQTEKLLEGREIAHSQVVDKSELIAKEKGVIYQEIGRYEIIESGISKRLARPSIPVVRELSEVV